MTLSDRTVNSINNVHQLQPLVIAVIFPSLATVAVVLRLISKRIIKTAFGMDDYMILAALVWRSTSPRGLDWRTNSSARSSSGDWRHVTFLVGLDIVTHAQFGLTGTRCCQWWGWHSLAGNFGSKRNSNIFQSQVP